MTVQIKLENVKNNKTKTAENLDPTCTLKVNHFIIINDKLKRFVNSTYLTFSREKHIDDRWSVSGKV